MKHPFLLPSPVRLSQVHQDGAGGGGAYGDPVTRRKFLKRTGGATVASVVAFAILSPTTAEAHEPEGSGGERMLCTEPEPHTVSNGNAARAGAPGPNGSIRVKVETFSSDWEPTAAATQYRWIVYGYIVSRAKDITTGAQAKTPYSKDEPEFEAGGVLARQRRSWDEATQTASNETFLDWNPLNSTWKETLANPNAPVDRPCLDHTRKACVACHKDTGAITSHASGDLDNGPIGGMQTNIDIAANGNEVIGKAKFITPGFTTGEITLTVKYSSDL